MSDLRPSPFAIAAEQATRWGHIAATILRARVVPFPRVDRGLAELVPLTRLGTTLGGLYAMAAAASPRRVALVDDDRAVTYAELDAQVGALASQLAARFEVGGGSAVGILARNHIAFVQALLACSRLGADAVLLNTGMSEGQAVTVAEQQQLVLLMVDAELLPLVADVPADVPRVCTDTAGEGCAGTVEQFVAAGGAAPPPPDEEGRTVVMTSGTTGAPKGARRPGGGGPDAAASILSRIPLRAEEPTHIAAPLFHTWGLANLQLAAMLRSTVVLRRRFDPVDTLRLLSVHRCSAAVVVPVMLQRILELDQDEWPAGDWSALRIVASSGSALPGDLATRWMDVFGPCLYNLYGSTEVSWATIATPDELRAHPGTAGRPPRGTRVAIIDDADRPLPSGQVGRIVVGNGLQFEGYTGGVAGASIVDGMMATGDVGYLDASGLLFVVGRDDDMIVSGGENVHPKEVEDLLATRDDVADVAVVGVDDAEFGQRLAAFVVPRDVGAPPDPDALRDHVRRHLARFSVPRDVVLVDALPRNATGKVLTRELRAMLDGR